MTRAVFGPIHSIGSEPKVCLTQLIGGPTLDSLARDIGWQKVASPERNHQVSLSQKKDSLMSACHDFELLSLS